ncbi:MAG: hypothetical protein B6244_04005 [Candidatus Cloacimonetes bacterium 4572_55]|nr:MAG: hypothetical protein B6244_04005 [Candidatus Cloacimonetes bacterium 4572_55]
MRQILEKVLFLLISVFLLWTGASRSDNAIMPPFPDTTVPDKVLPVIHGNTLHYTKQDTILCQKILYEGLMDDIQLSANIVNILYDRNYELILKDSLFIADDHKGLKGEFILSHRSAHRHIYYGDGKFNKKWIFNIKGRAIIDIFFTELDSMYIARDMALYLKVDSGALGFLTKIASKVPLLNNLVRKFAVGKALSFASLSRVAAYQLNRKQEETLIQLEENLSPTDYQKLVSLLGTANPQPNLDDPQNSSFPKKNSASANLEGSDWRN